jgi:putative transposase
VILLDRRSNLLVTQIDALRDAVRQVRARAPFHIDAWVVLPDHMHCLWTPGLRRGRRLPEGDADFAGRWRAIKKGFSKSVRIDEPRSPVMIRRGERGIWQRRYWEHTVRDQQDFATHFDYIHFNPVKHGLVEHPAEWPHSSFRRCVATGCNRRGGCAAPASRRRRVSGDESKRPKAGASRAYRSPSLLGHSPLRRRQLAAEGAAPFRPTLAVSQNGT